jgi:hypothetical protein
MSEPSHCRLIIREGPFAGKEFDLEQPQVLLGRDSSCDIHLDYEAVSRRHARLTWQGHHYTVEDLASSNGTYLNSQLLEIFLQHSDQPVGTGCDAGFTIRPPGSENQFAQATIVELLDRGRAAVRHLLGAEPPG